MSYLPRFKEFRGDLCTVTPGPAFGEPSEWSGKGRTCVFDLEGDGLIRPSADAKRVSVLHCAVAIDVTTGEIFQWRPWQMAEAARFLSECEALIGHNILDFDLRALAIVYPGWTPPAQVYDTLVMVRVIWPADTLIGSDLKLIDQKRMPPKYLKAHSLAAWGFRLGNYKGDYHGPWDVWSEEMQEYMVQDGLVNLDLWKRIVSKIGWAGEIAKGTYVWPALPFEIEHEVSSLILQQEETGFAFDREAAVTLSATLQNLKLEREQALVDLFGSWWAVVEEKTQGKTVNRKRPEFKDVTIPREGKNGKALKPYVGPPLETTFEGSPFTRIERVTFQPSSRDHLGQRLQAQFGWRPSKYGANGKPTVDESTLKEIPEKTLPPALRKTLLEYFVVVKTLGQLSVGRKSWMAFCGEDSRIHGRMNPTGAITGRGIHMDPNLGQVPGVVVTKDHTVLMGIEGGFGMECRSLFMASTAPMSPTGEDWELTGTDATALELICLGQYLQPLDGGSFLARVCDPNRDAHTEHAELTGLNRHDTKTVTYAYVYGASAPRVGEELEIAEEEIIPLLNYRGLPQLLNALRRRLGDDYVEPDDMGKARLAKGRIVILKFEKGIPGIKDLKEGVTAAAESRKWLKGLDGRKLYVRKAHAALNTLLQGAGAIICKLWMVLVHRRLAEAGLIHGRDYRQVAWVHDELQIEHRPGLGAVIGEIAKDAIREAGEVLRMHGPLRGEAKTGRNWAETH